MKKKGKPAGALTKCPDCGGPCPIHHTYAVEGIGRVSEGICENCYGRFKFATIVVGKVDGFGTGSRALAKQLERGGKARVLEVLSEYFQDPPGGSATSTDRPGSQSRDGHPRG